MPITVNSSAGLTREPRRREIPVLPKEHLGARLPAPDPPSHAGGRDWRNAPEVEFTPRMAFFVGGLFDSLIVYLRSGEDLGDPAMLAHHLIHSRAYATWCRRETPGVLDGVRDARVSQLQFALQMVAPSIVGVDAPVLLEWPSGKARLDAVWQLEQSWPTLVAMLRKASGRTWRAVKQARAERPQVAIQCRWVVRSDGKERVLDEATRSFLLTCEPRKFTESDMHDLVVRMRRELNYWPVDELADTTVTLDPKGRLVVRAPEGEVSTKDPISLSATARRTLRAHGAACSSTIVLSNSRRAA